MARIYDNINNQFTDGLKTFITEPGATRVDFCVGYFNLRGWDFIDEIIDQLPGEDIYEECENATKHRTCRLLVGMHPRQDDILRQLYGSGVKRIDAESINKYKYQIAQEFKHQLHIGYQTNKDKHTLQHLSQQLKNGKLCVKLYLASQLHAKLYVIHYGSQLSPSRSLLGSSNLTYSGLKGQGELDTDVADNDSNKVLDDWFEDKWNNRKCVDISAELADIIDNSWAAEEEIPPYYIYLRTAYMLSRDVRDSLKFYQIPMEFDKDLFQFQKNAVKILCRHLNNDKRNGALLGDVVGLGKTITACCVAKIYENTYGCSSLVICPANLQKMWKGYVNKYDLKTDIISNAVDFKIDEMKFYRLIIIDESHNLRNENGRRYKRIKDLVKHQGSSVLLLTATPYNKDYRDISAQLKLFISEDQDLGVRPEKYIEQIGGERAFMQKHSEILIRSINAFEKSNDPDDWNSLIKLFMVRRTRTFIQENFAKLDANNGRRYLEFSDGRRSYFPKRLPKAIKFPTEGNDQFNRLYSAKMVDLIESLSLPRYGLSNYLNDSKIQDASDSDKQLFDNLSRAGVRMMGFCKSTFFKRMDSSGFAFLLTLYRHILRNAIYIYAISNNLDLPIGDENELPDDFTDENDINSTAFNDLRGLRINSDGEIVIPTSMDEYMDIANVYYNDIKHKSNLSWLSSKYFKRTLKQKLKNDCETIISMIEYCGAWQPQGDKKLISLINLLTGKHANDKVLIFTQFSDTAEYIYRELKEFGISNVDIATGDSEDPTSSARRFSPVSNGYDVSAQDETRVLIATDVLSEGQNLQDAHIILNYDLPWAIIRLIQRAGRVDRIGQTSEEIMCYSFFPANGIEQIIGLRQRLNNRINENANAVGSDEVFFEGNEKNLMDLYNEKANLDEDEDSDVDLMSQAYQIWKHAITGKPELEAAIENLPDMAYATMNKSQAEGVVTYAKTYNGFDILSYLGRNGETITTSQSEILKAMACQPCTPNVSPLDNHFNLVKQSLEEIKSTQTRSVGGILGSRFSTRYRVINKMEEYFRRPTDIFYSEDKKAQLKNAIDEVYNNPLLENSKSILSQHLRSGISDDDLIDTIISMHESRTLCHVDDSDDKEKEPHAVCSLGVRNEA